MFNKPTKSFLTGDCAKCLALCAVMVLAMGASNAFAAAGLGNAICTIPTAVITGNIGRGIATIGIIILGVMATLGRITWTQAMVVGIGIAVIFGAAALAGMIAMGAGTACP